MLNPFGPQREPGLSSHINLKQRTLQKVQTAQVNDQIFQIVQNAFEQALNSEYILLSRPERKLLFLQILRSVLMDMVQRIDNRTKPAA